MAHLGYLRVLWYRDLLDHMRVRVFYVRRSSQPARVLFDVRIW